MTTDYLTADGAAELAKRINDHWAARNVRANARVETQSLSRDTRGNHGCAISVVRSDLDGTICRKVAAK